MHLLDVCLMIARCLLDRANGVFNGDSGGEQRRFRTSENHYSLQSVSRKIKSKAVNNAITSTQ